MPAEKYLYHDPATGLQTERAAAQSSTGASEAGRVIGADETGLLDASWLPTGTGREMETVPASEALSAGDAVNFWSDAGTVKARKADASTYLKPCDGFVLAAVASGASATVYRNGRNTQVTALTVGPQYLSATTPGKTSSTIPTGTDKIVQRLGYAITATSLAFNRSAPIRLA